MSFVSRLVYLVNRRLLKTACGSCAARKWKSTINLDRSLEHGSLIPNIHIEDTGTSTHVGKRRYQEDRFSVKTFKDGTIYLAVFDGHGGSLAADYALNHLPLVLEKALMDRTLAVADSMEKSFIEVSSDLSDYIRKRKDDTERYCGTTATVCVIRDNIHLHTASVGDSRAILCRKSAAVPLTSDHSPDRNDEVDRVKAEGGVIVSNSLGEPLVNGRLAMTRSIGDFDLKPYGVTAKPEYTYKKLNHSKDSFLALVTDGVTFSITNQEVANIVLSASSPPTAAGQVTDMSLQLGSQDNNTAIVLPLGAWGQHEPLNTAIEFELGRSLSPND